MAQAHKLLDFLKQEYELKSDSALAKALGLSNPYISKIRSRKQRLSAETKIIIYKKTGMSIEDIENLLEEKDGSSGV